MNHPLFRPILLNVLFSSVTNAFVWFVLTFWVFLSTRSILATSVLAGLFAVFNALTAIYFGALVDHHRKHLVLAFSSASSLLCFLVGGTLYLLGGHLADLGTFHLWAMICVLMLGTVIGNICAVALSVVVKILFNEEERPKANGLVGMVNGVSFATTSVLSGFAIGTIGMGPSLMLAIIATLLIMIHALSTKIPETHLEQNDAPNNEVDIRGTIAMVRETPGFFFLIFFTTFNNFLGGVFMALMDAYGLSLVDVKVWGVLLGILSFSFIGGGLVVARYGLGKDPVKKLFLLNMVTWTTCIFFTIQPSVVLLVMGMFVWMFLTPMIEASEKEVIRIPVAVARRSGPIESATIDKESALTI